jgi:hypothetical protein
MIRLSDPSAFLFMSGSISELSKYRSIGFLINCCVFGSQRLKCGGQIVTRHRTLQWHTFPGVFLQRRAKGGHCLFQPTLHRERGSPRLTVGAPVLSETCRERAPLDWAMTQNMFFALREGLTALPQYPAPRFP